MGTPMGTEELSNECRRCGSIGGEWTGDVGEIRIQSVSQARMREIMY